jgi:hypothetical protein
MDQHIRTVRAAGRAGVVGGVLTAAGGVVVQLFVRPQTSVAPEMWTYPWSGSAFVAVTLLYAALHLLVLASLWGFSVSGLAGRGRAPRVGHVLALSGTALLAVAEVISLFWVGQRMDEAGPTATVVFFGLGTVLTAVGFLVLGATTLRARAWTGWQRLSPLALGVWTTVLLVLVASPISALAIGVYGLLIAGLGLAMVTAPVPAADPAPAGGRAVVA